MITTGLPLPSAALAGIEISESKNVKEQYSLIATGGGFWVARNLYQNVIVKTVNGTIRTYSATCSTAFEANIAVNAGTLYFTFIRDSRVFLNIVNLTDNSLIAELFIADDTTNASLVTDYSNNQIIVFKHDTSQGVPGSAWFCTVSTNTFQVLIRYYATGLGNKLVHLYSDGGIYYRSYLSSTTSKISKLTQTFFDGEIYTDVPAHGETIIQNINSLDLYYPTVIDDRVYVLSQDATQFSAWDKNALNTQSISPITIDTRSSIQHSISKVQYERFQFDTSTNLLLDTRTFFIWNTTTDVEVTDRYPICVNEEIVSTYAITVSDRIPVRVLAVDGPLGAYRISNENRLYQLNTTNVCPLERYRNVKQQNIIDGARRLPFRQLEEHVGEVDNTGVLGDALYLDNNFTITHSGSELYVNGTTIILTTNPILLSKIEYNNFYYVRELDKFTRIDSAGTAVSYPASTLSTAQRYCFIFNTKFYVFTDSELSVLDLDTSSVLDFNVGFLRPNNVRLFVNPFTNELYLFDRDNPAELRLMNYAPSNYDFTNSAIVPNYTTLISTNVANSVGKTLPTTNWGMTQVAPNRILYIDYINQVYEDLFSRSLVVSFGPISTRAALEVGSTITTSSSYIFDRNLTDIIIIQSASSTIISQTTFKSEGVGTYNSALANALDYKLAVSTNSEGYLTFLTRSVVGASFNTSYLITFNRGFVREITAQHLPNTLRLSLREGINGKLADSVEINELEIVDYKIAPNFALNATTSNVGSKVLISESKEVLYTMTLSAVVNTDVLRLISKIFYKQWTLSSTNQQWEVFLDDSIYEQSNSVFTPRTTLPGLIATNTTKYVRYSVAITDHSFKWFSDEKYTVVLKLDEVSTNTDEIILA